VRGVSHVFQDSFKRFDFHGNVGDFPSENLGEDFSDFKLGEFFRTKQRINLSGMAPGICQNGCNYL